MPFANLPQREKDAFFSLLDEYFASRPEIFGQGGQHGQPDPVQDATSHAASAMKKAMVNNPEATAKVFSAGLKHVAASSGPPNRASPGTGNAEQGQSEPARSVANRIAAFSSSRSSAPSSSHTSPGLVASKKFGNLDTSSAGGFVSSLASRSSKPAAAAPIPPAFAPKANTFAPPPTRRFGASPSASEETSASPPPPPPPPPPPGRAAQQEESRGDWAEALYEYESAEPGDLNIKEGQRILVTERSSDDWWTGEIDGNGKSGLFPASYAKLL